MKPGLAELTNWNPGALAASAAAVTDVRAQLDRTAGDTEQSASWTRRGWDSMGADTAFAHIGSTQSEVTRIAELCGELESALAAAEADIARARDDALEAAAVATGEGFDVADDGVVRRSARQLDLAADSEGEAEAELQREALESRAQLHTTRIQTALSTVDNTDLAAATAIDALCSRMYSDSSVPTPSAQLPPLPVGSGAGIGSPTSTEPGWEFDPSLDPKTTAASVTVGGMVDATRAAAVHELRNSPDPVLNKIFGDVGQSLKSPVARRALQGVSRAGAVGAVAGAVPSIHNNIEGGMDPATAVGSEVVGAGTGLLVSAATAAAVGGMVGGPVGLVGGFIAGATFGALAGHFTAKGIQRGSHDLQEGLT